MVPFSFSDDEVELEIGSSSGLMDPTEPTETVSNYLIIMCMEHYHVLWCDKIIAFMGSQATYH